VFVQDRASQPGDASLVLHRTKDEIETKAWYRSSASVNENGNPVIYLNWTSASGAGKELDPPRQMVLYDVETNYAHDRTLVLGVISWQKNGDKLERHFTLQCQ